MTEKEVGELYTRLAFQYESSIDSLLARRIIDTDLATTSREKFYDSLNEEKLRTSKEPLNKSPISSNVLHAGQNSPSKQAAAGGIFTDRFPWTL